MTIASANYLPYVRTLMQSVRDTNPDYRRYLILVDKKHPAQEGDDGLFQIVEAEDLGIDSFEDMTVRYDIMELNTAVKPFAIDWLFENTDASNVIYLDPDIRVYRQLDDLERELDSGASVVVTPHLTRPLEDGRSPDDFSMLQAGVFNLGFIAVSRQEEARQFVRWWGRKLKTACHADFANNLFTDQRWIDLAPCFLENLSVLRNPAYNVAYWNLMQRPVKVAGNDVYFGGAKLAFFHFSGLQYDKPNIVSKHQTRLNWNDIKPLHGLFHSYRQALTANGWGSEIRLPYHYDQFGTLQMAPIVRSLYRELYPDPLIGVKLDQAFVLAMCNRSAGAPNDDQGLVTQLMYKVHRGRPDLQVAFPLNSSESALAFTGWFRDSGEREYGLDPRLFDPSPEDRRQAASANLPPTSPPAQPNQQRSWLFRRWRKVRKWLLNRI
jgi:hypothetical protein